VLDDLGELEDVLAPRDFAAEWRTACLGIDVEHLYVRASADLAGLTLRVP
jgi:hypothetical protein